MAHTRRFNWETDRALSVKVLLEANGLRPEQVQALHKTVGDLVSEQFPHREGTVKATIAEAGSRGWKQASPKIVLNEPDVPRPE